MINRPSAHLKSLATELAVLIHEGSKDPDRIGELWAHFRLPDPVPDGDTGSAGIPQGRVRGVGIWQRREGGGSYYYERDFTKKMEWPLWADVHRIYPKFFKKRVVLLGESAARGYFYEPFYTVAKELQSIIDANTELEDMEVIDLARTSIGMDELVDLAGESVCLDPDGVIIYAGNNWASKLESVLGEDDYREMIRAFSSGFSNEAKVLLERKFEGIVVAFMQRIKEIFVLRGIPVIFILPGFNLMDWRSDDVEKVVPWLAEGKGAAWIEFRSRAQEARERNDLDALELAALGMVEIDPTNPEGHEWAATAYLGQGKWALAVQSLELAKDAVLISRGSNSKPRCFEIIRKTAIAHAAEYGIGVIDAGQICKRHSSNNIPDRDLFLDYCHHTVAGIKVLMQCTAAALAKALLRRDMTPDEVRPSGVYPTEETIAIAHFCAAIHNAHYGQKPEILEYHCMQSVMRSGEVRGPMLKYINFTTRYAPTLLCEAFEELILEGKMRQYEGGLALPHPRGYKLLDIALVDAIGMALDGDGSDIRAYISSLRRLEHGIGRKGVNLLESFYCFSSYNEFRLDYKPAYFQARQLTTTIFFIADVRQPLQLEIVYRTPERAYEELQIKICLNTSTQAVCQLAMSRSWVKAVVGIEGQMVCEGVNELRIMWPFTEEKLQRRACVGGRSALPFFFPVYGEIFSLTASTAIDVSISDADVSEADR